MVADKVRFNVLVCKADFSKFELLGLLPYKKSQRLAHWLESATLAPFGKPQQIRTNNGSEFAGEFCAKKREHCILQTQTLDHSPWSYGRAERMV